jgi:hypothetical protein
LRMRVYRIFAIVGKTLGLRDIIMKIGRDSIQNFERWLHFGFTKKEGGNQDSEEKGRLERNQGKTGSYNISGRLRRFNREL